MAKHKMGPHYNLEKVCGGKLIICFYSGGDKTSVKTLTAYISHKKAKDPINLGAK